MASITTRAGKGSPLTNAEVDANFTNLNTELGTMLTAALAASTYQPVLGYTPVNKAGDTITGSLNVQGDHGSSTSLLVYNITSTDGRAVVEFRNDRTSVQRYLLGVDPDGGGNKAFALRDVTGSAIRVWVTSTGNMNVGPSVANNSAVNINKPGTGASTINGFGTEQVVQSDVSTFRGYNTFLGTQATSFTLGSLIHYRAAQGSLGAGSSVTSQNGFVADASLVGAGTNIGFRGAIPSGSNRWNLYMDGTAANYLAGDTTFNAGVTLNAGTANGVLYLNGSKVATSGSALTFDGTNLGIGATITAGRRVVVGGSLTGATGSYGILTNLTIQSDVTTTGFLTAAQANTASNGGTPYTISNIFVVQAAQGTFHADSTVTNQVGFNVSANLTGATNNYGFRGRIDSGTGRWNLYMDGTASNFLAGATIINNALGFGAAGSPSYGTSGQFLKSAGSAAAPTWSSLASGDVTTALGYTPYNSTNPSGYITTDGTARVSVENNGTLVGTRRTLNFIPGTGISLSITDDSTNEEVDVTITSTVTGGVTSFNARTGAVTLSSSDVTTALGYTPVNLAGDTMTGKLTVTTSASAAGLNLGTGVAPSSPAQGDLWAGTNFLSYRGSATTYSVAFLNLAQTFSGAQTFAGNLTANSNVSIGGSTTSTTSVGTNATTGTTTVGGTSQTGSITIGQSTSSQTINLHTGATASTFTKTLNIGTGGLAGSTTAITIGSTAGTVTVNANGGWAFSQTIQGSVTGNANTATTLVTARNIALTGDVTGTASFNGSADASIAATLANSGVTAGTYTKVTVDAKGRVTTGASLASADLPTYTGTLTSGQVTTALGYTPYNSSNPSGYITSSSLSSYLPLSGGTLTGVVRLGSSSYFTADATNGYRFNNSADTFNNVIIADSGNLTARGNVTAYSDERLKKEWTELPADFIERLAGVKNGTYTRIDNDTRQIGVSAQSLQPVAPEGVLDGEHLSVAYGNVALASAVELAKRIVFQEGRIKRLEEIIEKLIKE